MKPIVHPALLSGANCDGPRWTCDPCYHEACTTCHKPPCATKTDDAKHTTPPTETASAGSSKGAEAATSDSSDSGDAADKAKIEAAEQKKSDERERTRQEIFEEVEQSVEEAHDDIFLIHHDGGMELTDSSGGSHTVTRP